jgi:hypothetical protein
MPTAVAGVRQTARSAPASSARRRPYRSARPTGQPGSQRPNTAGQPKRAYGSGGAVAIRPADPMRPIPCARRNHLRAVWSIRLSPLTHSRRPLPATACSDENEHDLVPLARLDRSLPANAGLGRPQVRRAATFRYPLLMSCCDDDRCAKSDPPNTPRCRALDCATVIAMPPSSLPTLTPMAAT